MIVRLTTVLVGVTLWVGCKSQKKISSEYEAFLADTQTEAQEVSTEKTEAKALNSQEREEPKQDEIAWPTETPVAQTTVVETAEVEAAVEEVKIVVKEEEATLLEGEDEAMDEYKYHVIIGSFANENNARNYKQTMAEKGFSATILENNSGYYRVSVFQTQSEADARQRIKTIRRNYPQHKDVWLLNRTM